MNSKIPGCILVVACILFYSCSNKNKKLPDYSKQDSRLIDSLSRFYKENVSFAFSDFSIVYADRMQISISDTLSIGSNLFIDSVFYVKKDSDQVQTYAVQFVKKGKVGKGFMNFADVAKQSLVSKKDTNLLFIGNYLSVKDQKSIVLKSIRDKKFESEIALDTFYMDGFYLDMLILDSVSLANTSELFYVNTYYPACGYVSTHYYLDYEDKKFKLIFSELSWADAPYYNNPNIYLPTVLNSKNLLYQMMHNNIERDRMNKPVTYMIPENIKLPLNQLIYIERWGNTDSLVNGKTIMDEYDEAKLFDICSEKKLYKWDGKKLERVLPGVQ